MIVSVPLNLCCLASGLASDLLRSGLPFRAATARRSSGSVVHLGNALCPQCWKLFYVLFIWDIKMFTRVQMMPYSNSQLGNYLPVVLASVRLMYSQLPHVETNIMDYKM